MAGLLSHDEIDREAYGPRVDSRVCMTAPVNYRGKITAGITGNIPGNTTEGKSVPGNGTSRGYADGTASSLQSRPRGLGPDGRPGAGRDREDAAGRGCSLRSQARWLRASRPRGPSHTSKSPRSSSEADACCVAHVHTRASDPELEPAARCRLAASSLSRSVLVHYSGFPHSR